MTISNKLIFDSLKDWVASGQYDVFGTLNFAPGHKLRGDDAQKVWRHYWNVMDAAAYGKNNKHRIERIVVTQFGATGDNPHLHYLARSPIKPAEFCVLSNAIWANLNVNAAPPASNVILPVFDPNSVSAYLLHDVWRDGADALNTELSHKAHRDVAPHPQAHERLIAAAGTVCLGRANTTYLEHMTAAQDRYQKRRT